MTLDTIRRFLQLESAGGIVLMVTAVLGLVCANSPLAEFYASSLSAEMSVRLATLGIAKPLLLWINDGLMAIFFLLVGLEIKREILEGELSSPSQVVFPALAALGGMLVPAGFYVWFNRFDSAALNGWAIPAATDIAFALGVLLLLGKRVPPVLKVFLLTVAIFDDLGAIVIIALFYSADLSSDAGLLALGALVAVLILNQLKVTALTPYLLLGIALWVFVLKSGVHATLAGVALAFFIPMTGMARVGSAIQSPLRTLEHALHPWVAFGVLPIFAFANAGVPLEGFSLGTLLHPVPLGIIVGLFAGKQLGVFGVSWLAVRLGLARLPDGMSLRALYGVSCLCGIGFTMSLFIASLAFEHGQTYFTLNRLGIIVGSLLS
ncbi:Na+/H+ antiporter NhaA, partial [bacterium]